MDKLLKSKELSAYQLKWIAMITMTLDHFGKMFVGYWIIPLAQMLQISPNTCMFVLGTVMSVGQVTIYIFMWFVAEGCRYTHNIRAYIGRLLVFGLLSEIPFQCMIHIIMGEPLSIQIGFTNVMFTFALGAFACYGYELLKEKGYNVLCCFVPIACAVIAYLFHTDYDWFGVIGVFLLYIVQDAKKRLVVLTLMIVFFLGLHEPLLAFSIYGFSITALPTYAIRLAFALISVPLLAAYHGKRGKSGKFGKYLFYAYYPVHITILVLLFVSFMGI